MTLKQLRQLAAQNGHTGREPNDLTPRLPDDFPNESKRNPQNRAPQYPKTADKRLARRIVRMLESTTVVQEVDRFHRDHPGQKSRISTKALLLGMVLAAYETGRYLRSDICSYLNGLEHRLGVELGLWTWSTRDPVTYTMSQKQSKRLETAIFEARYSSNDQPRSIDWFMDGLFSDTIPNQAKATITTGSLDWTPIRGWAVPRDFRIEEEVRKEQEPEDTGEIGTLNLRDRLIRSADDEALGGHSTATNKTSAGPFTGYNGHIIIGARGATWNGNPKNLTLGPLPPKVRTSRQSHSRQQRQRSQRPPRCPRRPRHLPQPRQKSSPTAATPSTEKPFVRPLHRMGINVVMDYTEGHQKTIKIVTIGPEGERTGTAAPLRHLPRGVDTRTLLDTTHTPDRQGTSQVVRRTGQIPVDTHRQTRQERCYPIPLPTMRRQSQNQRQNPHPQQKIPTQSTLRRHHRPRILLPRHHHHPRRKTRHLPAHPLRDSRLEKTVRRTPANREPQQPRQKRRRPRRRLVPGTRTSRPQLRTPRSANRSQPTPTQQLRPRRRTTQRTATHPHHQPRNHTRYRQRAQNPRPTPITHPGTQHRQQPSLSALARPENQNPAPNLPQTLFG